MMEAMVGGGIEDVLQSMKRVRDCFHQLGVNPELDKRVQHQMSEEQIGRQPDMEESGGERERRNSSQGVVSSTFLCE